MGKAKLKSVLTSFTPEGDHLAVLSPDGVLKVWNTTNGSLYAEWRQSNESSDARLSCMACCFVGKKHRKEVSNCLVAIGTHSGDVFAVSPSSSEVKWKNSLCHTGKIASVSFSNKGRSLRAAGTNGMMFEMNSETGERIKDFKFSKKPISSSVCFAGEKIIAAVGDKIRVFGLENGKELLKFSSDLGAIQYISASDDGRFILTSVLGEKNLQLWKCDYSTGNVSSGPVLSMKHPPLAIESKNRCNGEDDLFVLSISEKGVGYIWKLESPFEESVNPTKIIVKELGSTEKLRTDKKNRASMIAGKLHSVERNDQVRATVTFGLVDGPKFKVLDVASPGEAVVLDAGEDSTKSGHNTVHENGVHLAKGLHDMEPEIISKAKNKRLASDLDNESTAVLIDNGHGNSVEEVQIDNDINEPTMGEKLASLKLVENGEAANHEIMESSPQTKPPSADSVHVLLKQALHADDRALLVDCLYRQDEKVVANSVSLLNPSDVLKLLQSLVTIIQSRGAVLACTLPWLRSLLLQHASGLMSQEASLTVLNSLYQLIESRTSTFHQTLRLSSCLNVLYNTATDDGEEENSTVTPFVFEDKDESDDGSEDAMETESDRDGKVYETFSDISDNDEGMGMSD